MGCNNLTSGIPRGCRDNKGGLYQFYIAQYPTVLTVLKAGSNSAITSVSDGTNAVEFYPFVPNKGSSEYIETYTVSNAGMGFEQKATMEFSKMEASKANMIKLMGMNDLLVVLKDKNGNYFLMGENDGAVLSGGNAGSGKALTDLNGYKIELTALEGDYANQIDESNVIVDNSTGSLTVA